MRSVSNILFVAALAVLAALGFYLGMTWLGDRTTHITEHAHDFPESPLAVDTDFPDAMVVDTEAAYSSADLIGDSGAVVMFLEIGCPPCSVMAVRWAEFMADGMVPSGVNVFGISSLPQHHIGPWREALGLGFPIYTDSTRFYDRQFGIIDYPQRVEVGASRYIRHHSYLANETPNRARLASLADR
jgi:peroxiredoxin